MEKQLDPKMVGSRIKNRRKELGMSAEEVAEKMGVSPATVYRYESAKITNMGIDKLQPIAEVLKTTPSYLMGWSQPATSITELTKRLFPDWKPGDPIPDGSNSTWNVEARLDDDTLKMLENYFRLNGPGQLKAQQRIEELAKYNKYLAPAYKEKSSASNEAEEEVKEMEAALRRMFEDLGLVEGGELSSESLEMIKGFLSLLRAQRRKHD